jgi:UDP-glucose 4-epimerase
VGRIALTGTSSFLGARLLRRLAETREPDSVVAIDIAPPPPALGVRFREVDFTRPASDQALLDAFREEQVQTAVHMAFFTNPQRDRTHAHELESIGTLALFAAAAAAGLSQVVLRSFTAVYGARGQNPAYLTEARALPSGASLSWLADKLEAEGHAATFARRYPQMAVGVLRFAPLFGPGVRTFYTRIFDNRVVPVLMGYDPLVQMLHPEDALEALELALEKAPRGALNIVPRAVIPLRAALHLAGKIPVPVAHPVAYAATELMWAAGLGTAPAGFVDFARYQFVADGARAAEVLGFTARHDSRESLLAYLSYRYPETAVGGSGRLREHPL